MFKTRLDTETINDSIPEINGHLYIVSQYINNRTDMELDYIRKLPTTSKFLEVIANSI